MRRGAVQLCYAARFLFCISWIALIMFGAIAVALVEESR